MKQFFKNIGLWIKNLWLKIISNIFWPKYKIYSISINPDTNVVTVTLHDVNSIFPNISQEYKRYLWKYHSDWLDPKGNWNIKFYNLYNKDEIRTHTYKRNDLSYEMFGEYNPSSVKVVKGWAFKDLILPTKIPVDVTIRPKGMKPKKFGELIKEGKLLEDDFKKTVEINRIVDIDMGVYSDVTFFKPEELSFIREFIKNTELK